MKHNMGKYVKYGGVAIVLLAPAVIFAQGYVDTLREYALAEEQVRILESVSLWSTILVAFCTSAMVWIGGRKMHGGVLGSVLTYFSIGMTLVFFGFATEVPWLQGFDSFYLKLIHDSLYIVGYVLMGIAASKLLRVIKGE